MMQRKSNPNLLDRFQFCQPQWDKDAFITCCPKTVFMVHPDLDRVARDVLVVYRDGRWHLVDTELYANGVFVHGLLRADLYDCIDIDGNRFLLISTYPLSGEMTAWRESVLEVVDAAIGSWVTMQRVEGDGYEATIMKSM
ncbi:hypothetical protein [Methylovulum psychrotolerans]|nr:hypothetical protein [Methylovulum psychrotolerans]